MPLTAEQKRASELRNRSEATHVVVSGEEAGSERVFFLRGKPKQRAYKCVFTRTEHNLANTACSKAVRAERLLSVGGRPVNSLTACLGGVDRLALPLLPHSILLYAPASPRRGGKQWATGCGKQTEADRT